MQRKYPLAGEIYESRLYPGQTCRVLNVLEAQVRFEWLGQYRHIEPQTAPVNRFIHDFIPAPGV